GLAMATPSSLERRLKALVNPILDRSPLSRRQMAWSTVALAAMLLPLAAVTSAQLVTYEINVRVIEANTGQGIGGTQVSLLHLPEDGDLVNESINGELTIQDVETDAFGRYRFGDLEPGNYSVLA